MLAMFKVMINHGQAQGEVWTTEGSPLGVAIWLPPGKCTPSEAEMVVAGIVDVAQEWGGEAMTRLVTLTSYLETLHEPAMPEPHFRLFFLGVEPAEQGKGVGGALVDRSLEREAGTPCYLETLTLTNVRFYERHGFRVVAEGDLPDSNIHVWGMRRG